MPPKGVDAGRVEASGGSAMAAMIAQASRAEFYLERQHSCHHPYECVRVGVERDGVWWKPSGPSGLEEGGRVGSRDFFRLHEGKAADDSGKPGQNAGNAKRSPGLDPAFDTDRTACALWAIANDGLRAHVGEAHHGAARTAQADAIGRYCGATGVQDRRKHPVLGVVG